MLLVTSAPHGGGSGWNRTSVHPLKRRELYLAELTEPLMVGPVGVEPTTLGLRDRHSAIELRAVDGEQEWS